MRLPFQVDGLTFSKIIFRPRHLCSTRKELFSDADSRMILMIEDPAPEKN